MLGEMQAVGQAVEDFESNNCGTGATANGDCSAAIGRNAQALEDYSVAIGDAATVGTSGVSAISIGGNASGSFSLALRGSASAVGSVTIGLVQLPAGSNLTQLVR